MIKAIIFDMDGVIFDTENLWKEAFFIANKKFNANISEEERETWCGRPTKEVIPLIQAKHPELDATAYRQYMRDYVHSPERNIPSLLKNGFKEIVEFAKSHNIHLGLATSATKERVEQLFHGCGLDETQIFDARVTGDQIEKGKPDPFIYKMVCSLIHLAPNECIVLEDSPNGLMSAKGAGCQTIMVVDLIKPTADTLKYCDTVQNSLLDALDYIKSITIK